MRIFRPLAAASFVLSLVACSAPSQDADGGPGDAAAADVVAPDAPHDAGADASVDSPVEAAQEAGPTSCTPTGTTTPASFSLGDLGLANANHTISSCENGGSGGAWWSDVDFTGDGMPDGVGFGTGCTSAWKIYPWTASGFGKETTWNVPSPAGSVTSWSESASGGIRQCSATGFAEWSVYDIDGDHIPDLVWWRDDCDTTWTAGQWRVYRGGSSGFASSWTAWTVPEPVYTTTTSSCTSGVPSQWFVTDVDADGKPDVVATRDCADSSVGVGHWSVYTSSGNGFATTAKPFSLPALASGALEPYVGLYGAPVSSVGGTAACDRNNTSGAFDFFVRDLDGDGHMDLVVTKDDCDSASVGTTYWNVYGSTSSGFAQTPVGFSLPTPPLTGIWKTYGYGASCSLTDYTSFDFADYTGDARPDIVVDHDDCVDKSVGQTHWDVYVNTGTGFSPAATSWKFPMSVPTNSQHACGYADGSFFYVYWQTQDITGDGIPDFVLTENGCGSDSTLGVTHWDVYAGACP
jgi:hypothetical protein